MRQNRHLYNYSRAKFKKIPPKINKALNETKLIFLEVVYQALYSGKFWGNRFFSILYTLCRSLQQTALNVPGKKYPLFTASEQDFYEIKIPASP